MKLVWLSIVFIQLVQAANNYGFDQWSNNDLKQFLNDYKIKQDPSWDNSKLIEVATNEAKKLENGYKKLKTELDKQLQPKKNNLEDYLSFSFLFGSNEKKRSPIQDWFFESWNLDSLRKYLKHNGIKYSDTDNKSDLLKSVKSSFDKIAKKNKGSNYYPGSWLYDSWSNDDLTKWLKKYDVPFNKKSTREQLIDKVKEYNYKATNEIADTKDALFDSLDLFDKSIFDRSGQIKNEFFETWSYSQLREWLYLHGFLNDDPDTYVADLDKEKLIDTAQKYKKYLLEDIQTWLKHSERKVQPWLNKGGESSDPSSHENKHAKNLINDTFFVGIDNWSKDKLREFLNVRKVPYSIFTTRTQLVELVKEHRADPIHVEAEAYVIDQDFSTNSIKQWLIEQGQNIDGSRQDLISAFQEQFKKIGSGSNNIDSQIRFYTPDLQGYKNYLEKNVPESKKYSESRIKQAYKLVEEYFNKASETAKEEFQKDKYSAEEALQEIQKASYEYASGFYDEIDDAQSNISHLIIDARLASTNYVKSLVNKLVKDWRKFETTLLGTKKTAEGWIGDGQKQAEKGGQAVLKNVDDAKDSLAQKYEGLSKKAQALYDEYLNNAGESVDDLSTEAGKKYEEAAKEANYKYDQYVQLLNSKSDEVAEAAGKQYEKAVSDAQKKYDEYSTLFNQRIDELTNEAGKSYEAAAAEASKKFEEYNKLAQDTAADAYKEAGKQYEAAAAEANKKYNEYTKLAGKKYNNLSKSASKQYAEYSKLANKKVDQLSDDAAKSYEEAVKLANEKYAEFSKLASQKYDEWSSDATLKADKLYKEAGKQYELAAKDAAKKYDEYSSVAAAYAADLGAKASKKYNEYAKDAGNKLDDLSQEAQKQYEIAAIEAEKKYNEYSKIAGEKYEEYSKEAGKKYDELAKEAAKQYEAAKKDAGIKWDEYSKLAGEKAVEYKDIAGQKAVEYKDIAGEKATELGKEAGKKIQDWSQTASEEGGRLYSDAVEQSHKSYVKYSPKVQDWFKNVYRESLYRLGLFNEKVYEKVEDVGELAAEKWDSFLKTYSNADLKAYLRSFGYSYSWLSGLNRKELLTLAEVQEKLFTGKKHLKWERPIGEVLKGAGEDIGEALGIKKQPHGLVEHVKYYLGFNY
ncbi:hypothetical protein PVL30_002470 [Lodderomyces elongisporus]|uniref:uncharacterized protein n=1 Tax=Lodderomyces elongisporus TaxID=36914 RepID=UPI0029251330|nr:uncharacterized protein PVL30_002470 [Lodderomyces elongisporus]WLF78728.1 hypothetical protein PVL30_002470 [Lodderomyces elongisporus]